MYHLKSNFNISLKSAAVSAKVKFTVHPTNLSGDNENADSVVMVVSISQLPSWNKKPGDGAGKLYRT